MFRLDKVLRYKERLEQEALIRRAAAEAKLRELEGAAAHFRQERGLLPNQEESDVAQLAAWSKYAEGLRDRERRLLKRVGDLRPQVAEAVQQHVNAKREVEGLRRLRERTLLRQRKDRERKQQDLIDEAASRTFMPGPGTDCPENGAEPEPWPTLNHEERTTDGKMELKREKLA